MGVVLFLPGKDQQQSPSEQQTDQLGLDLPVKAHDEGWAFDPGGATGQLLTDRVQREQAEERYDAQGVHALMMSLENHVGLVLASWLCEKRTEGYYLRHDH